MTRVLGPLLALASLLVTVHSAWTYTGVYRAVAEFQLGMPGASYDLTLTFLLTLLVWLMATAAIIVPLRRFTGETAANPALDAWIQDNPFSLFLGILAVGLLGTAGWFGVDAIGADEQLDVELASLEAGQLPPSRWVTLHGGRADDDTTLSIERDYRTSYYVPLTEGAWPPVVFLELDALDQPVGSKAPPHREGMLVEHGLPGIVRTEYERAGLVGEQHWVLRVDETPALSRTLALVMGSLGVLSLFALVIVRVVTGRRRTNAEGPSDTARAFESS